MVCQFACVRGVMGQSALDSRMMWLSDLPATRIVSLARTGGILLGGGVQLMAISGWIRRFGGRRDMERRNMIMNLTRCGT